MTIPEWLDRKEAEGAEIASLALPEDLSYYDDLDETIFFEEINPCGLLCTRPHPFASVDRFAEWYICRGQDRKAGVHAEGMRWQFITRDRALALRTAESRIR